MLAAVTTAATVPDVKALECLSACEFSASPLQGFDLYSRFFIAGGICASFSHGVAIPFDVIKTRLQTASTAEFASSNVVSVAQTIIAREGPGMLFKGTGPTLVGYLIQGSLKYGFYEVFKPLVAAALVTSELADSASTGAEKLVSFMLAGAAAELIGSSFLAPFEAARIRLVANPSFAPGIVTCLTRIVDEETPEALFRGLPAILSKQVRPFLGRYEVSVLGNSPSPPPPLFCQVPYTVVQLSSYETLTTAVYSALDAAGLGSEAAGALRYVISAGCAVVAAVLSSLASQPGDTLLSAVNKSAKAAAAALGADGAAGRPQGPLAVMGATINELGVAGLFKGTKARLVHVTVIVVTQLLVYDFIKSLCGLPATGQH